MRLPGGAARSGRALPAGPDLVVELSGDDFAVLDPRTDATLADRCRAGSTRHGEGPRA